MNGYVKEQLRSANKNNNSYLQNSIDDWEYKINPGKYTVLCESFVSSFSLHYRMWIGPTRNEVKTVGLMIFIMILFLLRWFLWVSIILMIVYPFFTFDPSFFPFTLDMLGGRGGVLWMMRYTFAVFLCYTVTNKQKSIKFMIEQHKLISGNFLTTFSKDYITRTKTKRQIRQQQNNKRIQLSAEENTRPITPGTYQASVQTDSYSSNVPPS